MSVSAQSKHEMQGGMGRLNQDHGKGTKIRPLFPHAVVSTKISFRTLIALIIEGEKFKNSSNNVLNIVCSLALTNIFGLVAKYFPLLFGFSIWATTMYS